MKTAGRIGYYGDEGGEQLTIRLRPSTVKKYRFLAAEIGSNVSVLCDEALNAYWGAALNKAEKFISSKMQVCALSKNSIDKAIEELSNRMDQSINDPVRKGMLQQATNILQNAGMEE